MALKSTHFPKIFEPAFLGPLEVRNRLIMAPMGSRLANENGGVSPWQIDYYAERAKRGGGCDHRKNHRGGLSLRGDQPPNPDHPG